jgi:tetratricopeptide (TPR) repeat protein
LYTVAACAVHARQTLTSPGLWDKLRGKFQKTPTDPDWQLPNGASANQFGGRQSDMLLGWTAPSAPPTDEASIRESWPDCRNVLRLAENLFLIEGVETERSASQSAEPEITPQELAQRFLAQARGAHDREREAAVLTDLGVLELRAGDSAQAAKHFDEALHLAQVLELKALEIDIRSNQGLLALAARNTQQALAMFTEHLEYARATGDRLSEKLALDRQAMAYANAGQPAMALRLALEAIELARSTGDRSHEAELLWYVGIQHAELGDRDAAIASAQAAVSLMQALRRPQAEWFADYVRKYQAGEIGAALPAASLSGSDAWSGSFVASAYSGPAATAAPGQAVQGPGLLRMAITATDAMRKFIASGLKTSPADVVRQRLDTCRTCEHHTGIRCRVCGCFTSAKVKLVHEACPLGKWPA